LSRASLLEAACDLSESKHPDRKHDIRRCLEAIIEREATKINPR